MSIELKCDGWQLQGFVAHACHRKTDGGDGGKFRTDHEARKSAARLNWHSHKGRDFCPCCKTHLPAPQPRRHKREYVYLSNAQKRALRAIHACVRWTEESALRRQARIGMDTLFALEAYRLIERKDNPGTDGKQWRVTEAGADCVAKLQTGTVDVSQYQRGDSQA